MCLCLVVIVEFEGSLVSVADILDAAKSSTSSTPKITHPKQSLHIQGLNNKFTKEGSQDSRLNIYLLLMTFIYIKANQNGYVYL